MKLLATLALGTALLGGCASMSTGNAPATVSGGVLVGPNGMTLYTFDRDAAMVNKSVCNGACATNWPPLLASASERAYGDYTIITRDDGMRQWARKGKPLYYWSQDTKIGDRNGDNFQNVWHLAVP